LRFGWSTVVSKGGERSKLRAEGSIDGGWEGGLKLSGQRNVRKSHASGKVLFDDDKS
jgi:hypothetical protein